MRKTKSIGKTANVQTVNGVHKISKFVHFDPFPKSNFSINSEFFIFEFHAFFDGLIGYEFLQKSKAIIDAENNTLIFPDFSIPMKKKFPEIKSIILHPLETKYCRVQTKLQRGDFYLENLKIQPAVFIYEGIYQATDNFAYVQYQTSTTQSHNLLFLK